MSDLELSVEDVCLRFRIYGVGSQSLKKQLLSFGTGGRLGRDTENHFFVQALSDLTFKLQTGDKLGIMGANGAGKSTLLRILAGIYRPQSGVVRSTGQIAAIIDPSVALDSLATGYENILSRARLLDVPRAKHQRFTEQVREVSELGDYLSMPVHTYSSGMLMRLNFAMSVSIEPDILLLDEWLSVADQSFSEKAEEHMRSLVGKTRILVLASHNLDLLQRVCNKGLFLKDGQIACFGSIEDAVHAYNEHG